MPRLCSPDPRCPLNDRRQSTVLVTLSDITNKLLHTVIYYCSYESNRRIFTRKDNCHWGSQCPHKEKPVYVTKIKCSCEN